MYIEIVKKDGSRELVNLAAIPVISFSNDKLYFTSSDGKDIMILNNDVISSTKKTYDGLVNTIRKMCNLYNIDE